MKNLNIITVNKSLFVALSNLAARYFCSTEFTAYTFPSFIRRYNLDSPALRACAFKANDGTGNC